MSTDHVNYPTTQELQTGYQERGTVQTLFGLFPNKKQFALEEGQIKSMVIRTVGDLNAKQLNPVDTERKHVQTVGLVKTFNRSFFSIKYEIHGYQNKDHINDLNIQVNDQLLIQQDLGLSQGSFGNNGLFVSSDPDYVTISPATMTDYDTCLNIIKTNLRLSNNDNGNGAKTLFFYGTMATLFYSFISGTGITILEALQAALPQLTFVELPAHVVASGNGIFIVNMALTELDYTLIAGVKNSAMNEENNYFFINYDYGSMGLKLLAPGAIYNIAKA
jgi:hypothetical protein